MYSGLRCSLLREGAEIHKDFNRKYIIELYKTAVCFRKRINNSVGSKFAISDWHRSWFSITNGNGFYYFLYDNMTNFLEWMRFLLPALPKHAHNQSLIKPKKKKKNKHVHVIQTLTWGPARDYCRFSFSGFTRVLYNGFIDVYLLRV